MIATIPDDLISTGKAAKILATDPSVVYRWVQGGKLRGWKRAGHSILVSESEVRGLLVPVPSRLADADAAAAQAKRIGEQKERLRRRHGMRV